MSDFDLKAYAGRLRDSLSGKNIRHVSLSFLESKAKEHGQRTIYGSYGWRSFISNRLAPKTVYLGTPEVQLPRPTELHRKVMENAPKELEKVLHLLKTLPFYHIRRQMGNNDGFNPTCDLYVSAADPKNARLGFMWGSTMFPPSSRPGPTITMIHIPEEHQLNQQVLSIPEHAINIALGTDYMGEDKKGFLRQAMWLSEQVGMLGLHAGTKMVTVEDARTGKLNRYGVFLFGLTATGKSTWSCHQLGLDHALGEKVEVAQDDIVFLRRDGSAYGSENNFYIKTDIHPDQQEAMYNALIDRTALFENVMIKADGTIDFLDEALCANGRGIVRRDKLRVKVGGKLVGISAPTVNLPSLKELDGILFAFITRRNTIMPFAQELTPEQGVLSYLWGESTHSFASQPAKAGESVRIVGTDPFIIGSRARKVNTFYDIVMNLVNDFPGKVRFMQYNTGGIGEILDITEEKGVKKKTLVRKTRRVPLDLMAAIQRGDLRGTNHYEMGVLGTRGIVSVEGKDLDEWDPRRYYSSEQIDRYILEIVEGRRKWTQEVAEEGLKPEILQAAEDSFAIEKEIKRRLGRPSGSGQGKVVYVSDEPVSRPKRPGIWRWR